MPSTTSTSRSQSKFTRGEKCIFAHVVVTFALLIVLVIVYFVHVLLVHRGGEVFVPSSGNVQPLEKTKAHLTIGIVYVQPDILMCNALLIRHRWSLAPAHCVAARAEPELADLVRSWRIRYRVDDTGNHIETTIKRSIAHPHFDSDDYRNNIGLFEHDDTLPIYSFPYPGSTALGNTSLMEKKIELIGWEDSWHKPSDEAPDMVATMSEYAKYKKRWLYLGTEYFLGEIIHNTVRLLDIETCSIYIDPITPLRRQYEYCFTLRARRNVSIVAGAMLAIDSEFVGFFSWGDSQGSGVPLVVIDFMHFKDWIRHIISI